MGDLQRAATRTIKVAKAIVVDRVCDSVSGYLQITRVRKLSGRILVTVNLQLLIER
jgi:hypothetical protein